MSFEDIPEDRPESFPCECGGDIKLNDEKTLWECDLCTFSKENKKKEKIKKIDCHWWLSSILKGGRKWDINLCCI